MNPVPADVYLGLGTNVGDRMVNLAGAVRAIASLPDTRLLGVSNVVESEPWGVTEQPPFANAVVRVETAMRADRLRELLQGIERDLGRRPGPRNGPRVIDLDILLFGDEEWEAPDLTVPHPRMAERAFVIEPLLELAPGVRLPDGSPVSRERATEGRVTTVIGPVPGFEDLSPPLGGPGRDAVAPGDWVVVASALQGAYMSQSIAQEVLIKAGVLEAHGIPSIVDPMPFSAGPGLPYPGVMETVRLYVPRSTEAEAREILGYGEPAPPPRPLAPAEPERSGYPDWWRIMAATMAISIVIGMLSGACNSVRLMFGA